MTTVLMLKLFTKQICRCKKTIKIVFSHQRYDSGNYCRHLQRYLYLVLDAKSQKKAVFCCCNYRKYIVFFKYRIEAFNNPPRHNFQKICLQDILTFDPNRSPCLEANLTRCRKNIFTVLAGGLNFTTVQTLMASAVQCRSTAMQFTALV